jgi:ERF superfamily
MNHMSAAQPVPVKKSRTVTNPPTTAPGAPLPVNELARSPESLAAHNSLLTFVAQAVRDPAIDVAKLEALLRMQREIVAEDARLQFNRSFAALSAEITQIERRGVADMCVTGAYKFAKREDLDAMLRPLMREHGFAVSFRPVPGSAGHLTIEGELMHVAGHSKTAELTLPPDIGPGRNSLQAMGSAISYAERYLTEMLLNVVRRDEDDDGASAADRLITDEQLTHISRLIHETKANVSAFLKRVVPRTERLADIRTCDFAKCVAALETKRRRMKATEHKAA